MTQTESGAPRTTTVDSGTRLTAQITLADLATAGTVLARAVSAAGEPSNALPFAVNNPAPAISGLDPASATAGSGASAAAPLRQSAQCAVPGPS